MRLESARACLPISNAGDLRPMLHVCAADHCIMLDRGGNSGARLAGQTANEQSHGTDRSAAGPGHPCNRQIGLPPCFAKKFSEQYMRSRSRLVVIFPATEWECFESGSMSVDSPAREGWLAAGSASLCNDTPVTDQLEAGASLASTDMVRRHKRCNFRSKVARGP